MNKLLCIFILSLPVVLTSASSDYDLCHLKDETSKSACHEVTKALATNETYHCCWMEIKDKSKGSCEYVEPSKYSKYWSDYEKNHDVTVTSLDCSANFLYLSYLALIFVLFI